MLPSPVRAVTAIDTAEDSWMRYVGRHVQDADEVQDWDAFSLSESVGPQLNNKLHNEVLERCEFG